MSNTGTIKDLVMDGQNANKHTQKGDGLMEKSLRELGFGRSILVDKNNNIIAGNGITGKAVEIGIDKVRFIDTTGNEIVAVRRTDIDINTKEGRAMAIADNQTAAVGIDFDMDVIEEFNTEYGIDLNEEYGIEKEYIDTTEKLKTIKEEIEPFNLTHILFSFPADKYIEIKEFVESIMKIDGVNYEQSSN